MTELGIFFFNSPLDHLPENIREQMTWLSTAEPDLIGPLGYDAYNVWLNWYGLHPPYGPWNPFRTEEDLETVEAAFKALPINFWGTLFVCEETYKEHIRFDDGVDTTWFDEEMLGHDLYGGAEEDWWDEMFLRMVRGFYNYYTARGVKVGITTSGGAILTDAKIVQYYGWPAFNFIKNNYDFVSVYIYTTDEPMFNEQTVPYLALIDQHFGEQEKFWVITRKWDGEDWEEAAVEWETHACIDRDMSIHSYYTTDPPLADSWQLILDAIGTYESRPPPSFLDGADKGLICLIYTGQYAGDVNATQVITGTGLLIKEIKIRKRPAAGPSANNDSWWKSDQTYGTLCWELGGHDSNEELLDGVIPTVNVFGQFTVGGVANVNGQDYEYVVFG